MRSFLAALFVLTVAAGCAGSQSTTEARNDPSAVTGDQQAVLRSTAMREASAMGGDLLETLRIANERTRADASEPPPARFNTLLAALEKAGLADTLQSSGPFTLLAPTDDAFRRLPTARLEAILQDPKQVRRLLRAHLLEGNYVADELAQRSPVATMLEGRRLAVEGEDQNITIEDARVLQADAGVSNGTIHVIDTVLLPSSLR